MRVSLFFELMTKAAEHRLSQRRLTKVEKIIFKRIKEEIGSKDIGVEEFWKLYLGNLAWLYHDTYGIPDGTIRELFRWQRQ